MSNQGGESGEGRVAPLPSRPGERYQPEVLAIARRLLGRRLAEDLHRRITQNREEEREAAQGAGKTAPPKKEPGPE